MTTPSVPCPSCSAPIRFGEATCPSCRAPVPAALREALEARLEAMSEDLRDLKGQAGHAAITLLVVAILYAGYGVLQSAGALSFGLVAVSRQEGAAAFVELLGNLGTAAGLAGCFAWARRSAAPALATGLLLWLAVQVSAIAFGGFLLSVPLLLGRIVVAFLLVRGILSARKIGPLRERLARGEDCVPDRA